MVKTLHFHCGEHRFYPQSGNLRSHMLHGQKNYRKEMQGMSSVLQEEGG